MRAVSAKALYILLLYMLLPFAFPFSRRPLVQGDHHMHEITQGVALLYPGLCAFALSARAGQYNFCEQVVRVNQEQFHFEYIKLYTLIIK